MADRLLGQQGQGRVVVHVDPPARSIRGPQWPWSVYSQKQRSVITSSPGAACLASRTASCTIPPSARRRPSPRVLVLRDAEEEDRRDAQLGHLRDRLAEPVERELVLPRHRRDLAPQVRAVVDEHRINQVVDASAALADQVAEPRMAAEPAGTMQRITRGGLEWHSDASLRSRGERRGQGADAPRSPFGTGPRRPPTRPMSMAMATAMSVAVVVGCGGCGCSRTSLPLASSTR